MVSIQVVNRSPHPLPEIKTIGAAGYDICAWLSEPLILEPLARAAVPTGLFLSLPQGVEAQIRPRSGMSLHRGITVLNAPGTIDSDFRGEINVLLVNLSDRLQRVSDGERIAQMVFSKYESVLWQLVNELSVTDRGANGFGHTGYV